jgi:hypothetical protein
VANLIGVDNALLQQAQLNALVPPTSSNLELLQEWLRRPTYGNSFLRGFEARTWDVEKAGLATLSSKTMERDRFTLWLFRVIPGWFHRQLGYRWKKPANSDKRGDLFEYKDATLMKVAEAITVVLSTSLPTLSIFVLYSVRSMPARLGLILVFTALFNVILLLVSRASKVEIFTATST